VGRGGAHGRRHADVGGLRSTFNGFHVIFVPAGLFFASSSPLCLLAVFGVDAMGQAVAGRCDRTARLSDRHACGAMFWHAAQQCVEANGCGGTTPTRLWRRYYGRLAAVSVRTVSCTGAGVLVALLVGAFASIEVGTGDNPPRSSKAGQFERPGERRELTRGPADRLCRCSDPVGISCCGARRQYVGDG